MSKGCFLLQRTGFSLQSLLSLRSTGWRCMGFSGSACRFSSWRLWALGRVGFRSCAVGSVVEPLRPWTIGSVVVVCGLSCSMACGIFLDQRLNMSPALAGEFPTTLPPRKSKRDYFLINRSFFAVFIICRMFSTLCKI